ncbi:tail fiber domain-containing protein [Novosphingobium colocasiae]
MLPGRVGPGKLLWNGAVGIDFTSAAQYGHQAAHFFEISGDGHTDALIRMTNLCAQQGTTLLTIPKSECRVMNDFAGVEGNQNAVKLVNPEAGARVLIHALDHISSIPDGGAYKKPADAISISGSNVPHIEWSCSNIRVRGTDTGADPAMLSHAAQSVSIPYTFASGRYSNLDRIDASQASTPTWLFGNNYTVPNKGPCTPAMVLGGVTPGYVLHNKAGSADLKGGALVLSSGVLSLRYIKDDNSTLTALAFNRTGSGLGDIVAGSHFRPASDNVYANGSASFRWTTIYASTGTINTSDEHDKHWIGGLTDAHRAAAAAIRAEIGTFQFNDSVAEKGEDGARIHVGVRAQRVIQILIDAGIEQAAADDWRDAVVNPYAAGTVLSPEDWANRTVFTVPERPSFRLAFFCAATCGMMSGRM